MRGFFGVFSSLRKKLSRDRILLYMLSARAVSHKVASLSERVSALTAAQEEILILWTWGGWLERPRSWCRVPGCHYRSLTNRPGPLSTAASGALSSSLSLARASS